MINDELERLIGLIYEGSLETQPWQSALPALRATLDAQVASLILRPPTEDDKGVILNSLRPSTDGETEEQAKPDDWQLTIYREEFFALDPFLNLPPGQVISLEDILPDDELVASDYYQHYLKPIGLFRIIGVDTLEPGGMLARLRFSRREGEPRFTEQDRHILKVITPHLERAVQIYAKLNRTTLERDLFAGAIDQLSVATIILDERAQIANTNAIAESMLAEGNGICIRNMQLQVHSTETNKRLQRALSAVIEAQPKTEASVVRAFSIPRTKGKSNLGLVIRPIPTSELSGGQSSPCAAVFISDPDLNDDASQQALGQLLGITPAEANLAILLARGHSLAQVSELQNVSQHTARAQLKSIFSKTGVSRQAELVRLVLKSVATLA